MAPLNEAAVSEVSKLSHDNTAHAAAGAAGGLYQLKSGTPSLASCRFVSWLAKPRGLGYDEFYNSMQPWTSLTQVSLWRRQMVLGPTSEFAMLSVENPAPMLTLEVAPVELEPVWWSPSK